MVFFFYYYNLLYGIQIQNSLLIKIWKLHTKFGFDYTTLSRLKIETY